MWNRVIRRFSNNIDDFVRVSFQSESHGSDRYNSMQSQPLLDNIQEMMRDGFKIADKTFKFLHYSNSQMKAHSCWFVNEKENFTYDDVIKSLGNFEKETKISKNASRKGQAFSSAQHVAKINWETQVEEIDDIKRGPYTFSDGCGEIEFGFAQKIAKDSFLAVSCHAFQIRMGGCKGVLVASNNKFEGDLKIKVRKSMKKFENKLDDKMVDLDVIRMATYSPGFLNKQIISILWANGVSVETFVKMQQSYVDDIINIYKLDKPSYNDEKLFMLFSSIKHIDYKLYDCYKKVD
jgi:RNA-dependent RNA polymerase